MQPLTFFLPLLYALFIWWFTTGLIMVVYGRSRPIVHTGFGLITACMVAALVGVWLTRSQSGLWAVYAALTCGVFLWGWQVASYYLGYITGPDIDTPTSPMTFTTRFCLALKASWHHEAVVVAFALLLTALTWNQPNRWSLWIFLAVWFMHSSGKLSVFFGVRNFYIDWLPAHLHHLKPFIAKRPSNAWTFSSIVFASSLGLSLYFRGLAQGVESAPAVGLIFVGTMILLGVLEHGLLILPIPATLWGWGIQKLPEDEAHSISTAPTTFSEQVAEQ